MQASAPPQIAMSASPGPDQPRGIADGLDAGRAGGDGRADRPLVAVADGDLTGRQIGQEGRHGERREASDAALIGGAHGLDDGRKAADPGRDDRRGPFERLRIRRRPAGLRDRLGRRDHREQDEAVHLALVLAAPRPCRDRSRPRRRRPCPAPGRRPARQDLHRWWRGGNAGPIGRRAGATRSIRHRSPAETPLPGPSRRFGACHYLCWRNVWPQRAHRGQPPCMSRLALGPGTRTTLSGVIGASVPAATTTGST